MFPLKVKLAHRATVRSDTTTALVVDDPLPRGVRYLPNDFTSVPGAALGDGFI
jgi:hypothetical protein